MDAPVAHCCTCAAAAAGNGGAAGLGLPMLAAIKALSLGYLLSLAGLGLGALTWQKLRARLPAPLLASAGSGTLLLSVLLQMLLAAVVWYGVVTHQILMTTNYFHALMYGGWGRAIAGAGLVVLGLSLLITTYSWRRASAPQRLTGQLLPADWLSAARRHGLRLAAGSGVATAALSGVLRPLLLVNPDYWGSLDDEQRELALLHEAEHLRRHDNLVKLLLEAVALLYGILPSLRLWAEQYETDCELAVDYACRRKGHEESYRALVAGAAAHQLAGRSQWSASCAGASGALSSLTTIVPGGLHRKGHSELLRRIEHLTQPLPPLRPGTVSGAMLLCLLASALPTLLLLSHPLSRCLLACYLGY